MIGWRRKQMVLAAGLTLGLVGAAPAPGGAAESRLSVFDGFSASHSLYMQGRANSVFALPADFFVGATFAEMNSQPRAQGYGATFGFPLARNATGVGVPAPDYRGQCWANYPGDPREDTCGLPARELPQPPRPPDGSPLTGGFAQAHVEASGDEADPEMTRALGTVAWGELRITDVLRIGYNASESRNFVQDGVLHAVTASQAQDITVGEVLHIGSVEAVAEATHAGDPAEAKGMARTDMQNVTVAGTPVTVGAGGLMVQGQPLGEAPEDVAGPILSALAAQKMTIEPLQPPRVVHDDATGLVEATTSGFRVVMFSPGGDKLEMIFGQAVARAFATRAVDDVPLGVVLPAEDSEPVEQSEPAAEPAASAEVAAPLRADRVPSTPAGAPALASPLPEGLRQLAAATDVELAVSSQAKDGDVQGRVTHTYLAMTIVAAGGVTHALRRRCRFTSRPTEEHTG